MTMTARIAPVRSQSTVGCPRCDTKGHPNLSFRRFDRPIVTDAGERFSHWALCPANGEPVLVNFVEHA